MAGDLTFTETGLEGAYVVDINPRADERGFFARAWCEREMSGQGVVSRVAQCNLAHNDRAGTLRGMHYQVPPHEEVKHIRCVRGAIHDVIIDIRLGSPTRGRWVGVDLTAENRRLLVVPQGVAHGYQTLQDDTEVLYLVSQFYSPGCERGIRWDDPEFSVEWPPAGERILSDKDRAWPDFSWPRPAASRS